MIRGPIFVASLLALSLGSAPVAPAQTPSQFGTIVVRTEVLPLGGVGGVCALHFAGMWLQQDVPYDFSGKFFIQDVRSTMSATLKLGINRMILRSNKIDTVPVRPTRAWFRSPAGHDLAGSIISSAPDDDPNEVFVVYRVDPLLGAFVRDIVTTARTSIRSIAAGQSQPLVFPLELDVVDTERGGIRKRSRREIDKFFTCVSSL